jgi:formate dehydrogenase subunit gamma
VGRHAGIDRVLHWSTAVAVLVLLGTSFLPILGIEFAWVEIHWWTGLGLMVLVLVHVVRALLWQSLRSVWIGIEDLRDATAIVRATLRIGGGAVRKPGKYSFAQKLIHLAFAVVVLAALATGALMMVKIDTPWWDRNPYWLSDATWGTIYVIHGLAALSLITMVMTHVYFALRPEKLVFLRSMLRGWITRAEYARHHDPKRWRVDE